MMVRVPAVVIAMQLVLMMVRVPAVVVAMQLGSEKNKVLSSADPTVMGSVEESSSTFEKERQESEERRQRVEKLIRYLEELEESELIRQLEESSTLEEESEEWTILMYELKKRSQPSFFKKFFRKRKSTGQKRAGMKESFLYNIYRRRHVLLEILLIAFHLRTL